MKLQAIAISADEQYVACFETGDGYKIRCFRGDGSQLFVFNIPSDMSAGGYCTLWFEKDTICAAFYRTDKVVCFALDGTILDVDDTLEEYPSAYLSFTQKGSKYIFNGSKIDVIYEKSNFLAYGYFDAERYLMIIPKEEQAKVVWEATIKEGAKT